MNTSLLIFGGLALVLLFLPRLLRGPVASPQAIKDQIAAGAMVLDVRTPAEFRAGAFPGAKNIPLQEVANRLKELPKNRSLIVYCASGNRSSSAAQLLSKAGYQVLNAGGLHQVMRAA